MNITDYTVEDFVCDQSFQNFCLGSNEVDIQFWEKWIASHPEKLTETDQAQQVISILTARQGSLRDGVNQLKDGILRLDLLKERLSQDISASAIMKDLPHASKKAPAPNFEKRASRSIYYGIAASLLVAFTGYWFWYQYQQSQMPAPTRISAIPAYSIGSGDAPRKTVLLPDGSVVTLRKNSTLTLSSDFDKNNRSLALSGEAFFDITKSRFPFIVKTVDIEIEVLGTVFNVSAYPSSFTEASLFTGKVAISLNSNPGHKIVLSPNQKFIVKAASAGQKPGSDSNTAVKPLTIDPVNYKAREIAWVRSQLKIQNESLGAIASKLQLWYGIRIGFDDEEVKTYRYSGTFENETVVKTLEALQLSYPFSFRVQDSAIIISK